ncbi:hypothetical protein EDB92DRAFT_1759692, partial [Lactarius akahatsu]
TIHMPDLQTTQEFSNHLRSSVLEDTGILSEDINSLWNPEPGYEFVDLSPLLCSLQHFINNSTTSWSHYNKLWAIKQLHRPDDPIMSFDQVKHHLHWLSGVMPIEHDMCMNSCVAFVGPYRILEACPWCSEPRYSPGTTKPQKCFTTIPVGPVIQALYSSHKLADKMHYLEKK